MVKYLAIKLKKGDCKIYEWDNVDFTSTRAGDVFAVRELSSGELLFCSLVENIEYIERIEK